LLDNESAHFSNKSPSILNYNWAARSECNHIGNHAEWNDFSDSDPISYVFAVSLRNARFCPPMSASLSEEYILGYRFKLVQNSSHEV
jgi:hypothetical protein